jgi:hemin uptake protein HemP
MITNLQMGMVLIYHEPMKTTPATHCLPNAPTPGGQADLLIHAQQLFGPSRVVFIEYRGERYQLRQTRNGKLILTK